MNRLVDERGKPFQPATNWGAISAHSRRWLDMEMEKLLRPSPLVWMVKKGELHAIAEECMTWESRRSPK